MRPGERSSVVLFPLGRRPIRRPLSVAPAPPNRLVPCALMVRGGSAGLLRLPSRTTVADRRQGQRRPADRRRPWPAGLAQGMVKLRRWAVLSLDPPRRHFAFLI